MQVNKSQYSKHWKDKRNILIKKSSNKWILRVKPANPIVLHGVSNISTAQVVLMKIGSSSPWSRIFVLREKAFKQRKYFVFVHHLISPNDLAALSRQAMLTIRNWIALHSSLIQLHPRPKLFIPISHSISGNKIFLNALGGKHLKRIASQFNELCRVLLAETLFFFRGRRMD